MNARIRLAKATLATPHDRRPGAWTTICLGAAALLAPVVLFPLVSRPTLAIGVTVLVVFACLAWHSVAWPIALGGLPAILIGLLGHNPFPTGAITMAYFGWTALAIGFAAARGNEGVSLSSLVNVPVIATAFLALFLLVRLGASPSYAYGSVKARLFVAENLTVLMAGIAIARYAKQLRLALTTLVVVACGTAVVLAHGLASGQSFTGVGGRLNIDEGAGPIALGRGAARGILVAVFLAIAAGPPLVRLLAIGALPLVAVSFVASGSRGPVIGLILGLTVLLALTMRDRRSRARILLVIASAVAAGVLVPQLVPGQDIQRALSVLTGSGGGLSSNGRYQLWNDGWTQFAQHPLAGIGTGGFASIAPVELYPHNIFLETGAELGIIGLLAVLGVIVGAVLALVRAGRWGGPALRPDVAIVAGLFAAAFVNAQVSGDLQTNDALWLASGLAVGLAQRAGARVAAAVPELAVRSDARKEQRGRRIPLISSARVIAPVERDPGAIVIPAEGASVDGMVHVAGRAGKTEWSAATVRLEVARDGITWEPAETASEAVRVVRDVDGFREDVALAQSPQAAKLLIAELERSEPGSSFTLVAAARSPLAADGGWQLDWDARHLPAGEYHLRLITSDIAGSTVASPPRRVRLGVGALPVAIADDDPFDFVTLERLVRERPHSSAYVQEEREAMLAAIHEHLDANGRIPRRLDSLLHETFGELLS